MDRIIIKCRKLLEKAYGDRFVGLIMYGSSARGEARNDSDFDLLVLLKGPIDYFEELGSITDLLYPIQLESERLISARPADVEEYQNGRLQLYRNALREGVSL